MFGLEALIHSAISMYGSFGLLLVMIVQTIIAPIPSEALLVFAGAMGIDFLDVIIFGGIGLVVGSAIAFSIGRYGGRPIIERLLGKRWTVRIDGWITKNGAKVILLTRLMPFVPFDLISYVSGTTSLSFTNYIIATIIGAFPRCILLAFMGSTAKGLLTLLGIGIELTLIIGMAGFVLITYLDRKGHISGLEDSVIGRLVKKSFSSESSTKNSETVESE